MIAVLIANLAMSSFTHAAQPSIAISWDRVTLRYLGDGAYPRMIRLRNGAILLSCDSGGRSIVRKSINSGATWRDPIIAATFDHGICANTQLLELDDGCLFLFYNERPRDGKHRFTIRVSQSRDGGMTWKRRDLPLYEADVIEQNGCWEPAGIQLKNGDVLVFFANENPYRQSDEQEISVIRSRDRGETWSQAKEFSFRAGARDGMPVPLILKNGKLVVAIEDEALTADRQLKPVILTPGDDESPITGNDPRRIGAVIDPWPANVYAGAPFVCQLKSDQTLLSCQSTQNHRSPRMVVYIGDQDARNFSHPSTPFNLPANVSGKWNSLFVTDEHTVVALTSTRIDGKRGVWAIDGHW